MKQLPKIVIRKSKRVGRGYGSGKGGHTAGRGTKGQKARGDVPVIFEGTKIKKSLIKRLPFNRGRGKFKPRGKKITVINLSDLVGWPEKQSVSKDGLIKLGFLRPGVGIKILGGGEIVKPIKVEGIEMSKTAQKKIEAAGGQII